MTQGYNHALCSKRTCNPFRWPSFSLVRRSRERARQRSCTSPSWVLTDKQANSPLHWYRKHRNHTKTEIQTDSSSKPQNNSIYCMSARPLSSCVTWIQHSFSSHYLLGQFTNMHISTLSSISFSYYHTHHPTHWLCPGMSRLSPVGWGNSWPSSHMGRDPSWERKRRWGRKCK
jgi:hypothetical protein